ncbi:hypothetical protein FWF93_01410 [Candidatus Saccharibacteria bacterium]|nr:hypothetical protein [Candidatus Saccharibacteria bacterium]
MGTTKTTAKDKEINYDIIYVDIDDDITSVIEKIKNSSEEYIKLVPPKRQGFMQSSVTMRLIKRTASKVKKHVAIVTTDKALLTLAATIGIYVAKNLQSEPIMLAKPETTASAKNTDDVIDGEDIDTSDYKDTSDIPEDKDIEVSLRKNREKKDDEEDDDEQPKPPKKAPNFNKFRKRLFIFGGLGVALIAFLVWAIVFAPRANVTIFANTTSEKVQETVQIGDKLTTDPATHTIKSVIKSGEKDASVDGTATGERNDGTRASGTVDLEASDLGTCVSLVMSGIASGTGVTLSGKDFYTTAGAAFAVSGSKCVANDVPVEAMAAGEGYNISGGGGAVAGFGGVSANGSTSGGSTKIVKFVQDSDIKIAQEKFKNENQDDFKNDLTKELSGDYIVISQSFKVTTSDPVASPGLNEASSDGKFKLTIKTVYSLEAVSKDEIKTYLEKILDARAGEMSQQKVYDYGVDNISLTNYMRVDDKNPATVALFATAKIGPDIDLDKIREEIAGKKPMEVTESLKRVNGVVDVKVGLSPFWVSSIPKNTNKIKIEFESNN